MGIRNSIRNFFYAATHANELIADNQRMQQELTENNSTIEMQAKKIRSMAGLINEIRLDNCDLRDELSAIQLHKAPSEPTRHIPVGRIDYLSPSGRVVGCNEYESEKAFIEQVKVDNYYGEPMSITVYSDPKTGAHIDTFWRLDLDPPPQGFRIEPYNAITNLTRFFTQADITKEIDFRIFSRVAIESTTDYSDPSFQPKNVDGKMVDLYRVVTIGYEGYHIAPMTRPVDSYEAAMEGLRGNPTVRVVPYGSLVKEVEERRNVKGTISDLSRYSTEQLQQALDQMQQAKTIEAPTSAPEPTPEFELE